MWHDVTVTRYNHVSNFSFSPVAPMQDLSTLKEQHREQKLLPQLLQFLCNTKRHCVEARVSKKTKLNTMMTWHLNISQNLVTFSVSPFSSAPRTQHCS